MRWLAWTMLMAIAVGAGAAGVNGELNPVLRHPHGTSDAAIELLIIKLRSTAGATEATVAAITPEEAQIEAGRQRVAAVAGRHGLTLSKTRSITARMHVMHLERKLGAESVATVLEGLRADPEVEYAEVDQRRYAHATPNDPLFATQQWYLQNSSSTLSAIDAVTAWDTTTGSSALVIADLDTGVRYDHPDLLATSAPNGRLLPGYCFISDAFVANGGNCPGADASDPGDWVTQSDVSHPECTGATAQNSSWHGTRTAGLMGAITNNATGIAGVTWQTQILPVRVLGKCGGSDSDIVTAMLWAAGIAVAGAPANTQPAKVINMSFGATGSCPPTYTDVISQVTAKGVLIVVSAGNEGGPVDAPANCPGVAAVAGLRHVGTKVGYSSLGPEVALSAPAGNCVNTTPGSPCLYPITTTFNQGTTTPGPNGYTDQVTNPNLGTSFSAPLVSGIGALMAAVNSTLNSCRLISRLREGALPYPQTSAGAATQPPMCHVPASASDLQNSECICTLDGRTCGAGMANAPGALKAAVRPVAAATVPSTVTAGQAVVLQGGASAAVPGHTISTYQWTNAGGQTLSIQGATTATATVTAPACGLGTVRLTVTDDMNRQDTADVVISPNSASTTAPASVSGTGACSVTLPTIQIAVCPQTDSVQAGGSAQTFTVTLANTSNTAVTWQVNGVTGGNATVGTISTSGVYMPPANVPSPATVTVSAVSVADPAQATTAQVTLTAPASGGSSGGGGGALDVLSMLALALAGLASAVLSPYNSRCAASSQGRCARR